MEADQQIGFLASIKGPLAGLTRIDLAALGLPRPKDLNEHNKLSFSDGHPKDPYGRIGILPSTRTVTAKVDNVTIAENSRNQFLHETMSRTRQYMPKTAVSVLPEYRASTDDPVCTLGVSYRE